MILVKSTVVNYYPYAASGDTSAWTFRLQPAVKHSIGLINTRVSSRARTYSFPDGNGLTDTLAGLTFSLIKSLREGNAQFTASILRHIYTTAILAMSAVMGTRGSLNTTEVSRRISCFHWHNFPDLWQHVGRGYAINSVTNLGIKFLHCELHCCNSACKWLSELQ